MGRWMIEASVSQPTNTGVKRFSLELGGDAPAVVFADADLDAAVADVVSLKFANGGQMCGSPNRCFVAAEVYEGFLEKAVEKVSRYVFGSADEHKGKDEVLQPVVSEDSLLRLLALVEVANRQTPS
jgi:succinate-semialdehyde dehydrogenase/glutarate-semialdehyde dehydrogenase